MAARFNEIAVIATVGLSKIIRWMEFRRKQSESIDEDCSERLGNLIRARLQDIVHHILDVFGEEREAGQVLFALGQSRESRYQPINSPPTSPCVVETKRKA